jgi:uncharacterized membrane protein
MPAALVALHQQAGLKDSGDSGKRASAMTTLVLGIILFLGVHILGWTPVRPALVARLGEGPWKGGFGIVALAGLGLMIWGLVMVRSNPEAIQVVYTPPSWARHATMALVLLGFVSLAISSHKGRLKKVLRNPMSIGIGLWAIGHLIANGNLHEVLFFGAFLLLAALDIVISTAQGKVPVYAVKPRHDLISIVAGVVLFFIFLWLHPYIIGVPVT